MPSDADAIDLAGQRREIATLFTDIAGFHHAWWRRSNPNVLGPLLNDYLTGMTDIVFAHDGTVAKIVGDALHVLFGAPVISRTMPPARWLARWLWIDMRSRSAATGGKGVSRWE